MNPLDVEDIFNKSELKTKLITLCFVPYKTVDIFDALQGIFIPTRIENIDHSGNYKLT